jgi:hypothetical protein
MHDPTTFNLHFGKDAANVCLVARPHELGQDGCDSYGCVPIFALGQYVISRRYAHRAQGMLERVMTHLYRKSSESNAARKEYSAAFRDQPLMLDIVNRAQKYEAHPDLEHRITREKR